MGIRISGPHRSLNARQLRGNIPATCSRPNRHFRSRCPIRPRAHAVWRSRCIDSGIRRARAIVTSPTPTSACECLDWGGGPKATARAWCFAPSALETTSHSRRRPDPPVEVSFRSKRKMGRLPFADLPALTRLGVPRDSPCLARAAVPRVEGHVRDAAYVDADRRQDPPRPHAVAQSHVAGDALSIRIRSDDRANAVRPRVVRDRLRLRRPQAERANEPRRSSHDPVGADAGVAVLCFADGSAGGAADAGVHLPQTRRSRESASVRRG